MALVTPPFSRASFKSFTLSAVDSQTVIFDQPLARSRAAYAAIALR